MSEARFEHRPVLLDVVVDLFAPVPPGIVVDATVGGAGHAEAIVEAHPHLVVLGIDQDADAVAAATARLARFGPRVVVRHARFDRLEETVSTVSEFAGEEVTGVLFDLGVSSPQLDRGDRGFSYRHAGPLDMRMDRRRSLTADDLVNRAERAELARILRHHGDERFAERIAAAVVAHRPVATTAELADIVRDAIPAAARRRGGHPAKRTFQALRIAVNEELAILPDALDQAVDVLAPGGRCVVLAYHSGEDRIVKARFRHHATGGWRGPVELPPPPDQRPIVRLLRSGALKPTAEEVGANPRAASARLRAVEKLPVDTGAAS
ncbi:MAG: 16S rRNA (cytosine(1402)-N(4))-methyltransferase RsmH [Acidimicrobiia bacterium]